MISLGLHRTSKPAARWDDFRILLPIAVCTPNHSSLSDEGLFRFAPSTEPPLTLELKQTVPKPARTLTAAIMSSSNRNYDFLVKTPGNAAQDVVTDTNNGRTNRSSCC